jgi:probable HAF family extracellular repeat protein
MARIWFVTTAAAAAIGLVACASEESAPTGPAEPALATLPTSYVETDLGTLGGASAFARAINAVGQIAGLSTLSNGQTHAFLWTNGVMRDLGTLGGDYSEARGINDRGHVVGVSKTATGAYRAFLWKNGVMTNLGTIGDSSSYANDINNHDKVAGNTAAGVPFLWGNGVLKRLALPTNSTGCDVSDINDTSRVVGRCGIRGVTKTIRWDGNLVRGIGTLPGSSGMTSASGLNKQGDIVGLAASAAGNFHPFLWKTATGQMIDLTTQGAPTFIPNAINSQSQIAGDYGNGSAIVGVVWQSGRSVTIGGQAGVDTYVWDINESGVVVGNTVVGNSAHAKRWTPQ